MPADRPAKPTPGIVERHGRACSSREGRRCNCSPTFEAWVWSPRDQRKLSRKFPTSAAAKSWRRDAASAVAGGKMRAPTKRTLRDAAQDLLDGATAGRVRLRSGKPYKPVVIRGYRRDLEHYVLPQLGARKLNDIERRDLQRLVDDLVAAGWSGSKIRNVITPIRVIYRLAIEADEVTVNPTTNLRMPEVGEPRDRVASPGEAQALIDAVFEDDQALWATAFYAGLRRGELRALRADDVDLTLGVIHVRHGWDDIEGEIDPKSKAGARDVPIPEALSRYIRAHMLRTGRRGQDLLFGKSASSAFLPNTVRRHAAKAWALAAVGAFLTGTRLDVDIDPIGLHEARHTYVSLMHAAGCSLEEIGDYVGHGSTYMTSRYRHLLPDSRRHAAKRLDTFLSAAAV